MRVAVIIPSAALLFVSASAVPAAAGSMPALHAPVSMTLSAVQQQAQPPAQPKTQGADVKLTVDVKSNRVWYADPLWITLGAIGLLVVVLIVVMASRGGSNTTVVR
jgi:hypothetical protein